MNAPITIKYESEEDVAKNKKVITFFNNAEIPLLMIDRIRINVGEEWSTKDLLLSCGVSRNGYKKILGFSLIDTEASVDWTTLLAELKRKGIRGVNCIICKDDPQLIKVLEEYFPTSRIQLCQVYLVDKTLTHVPQELKASIKSMIGAITAAPDFHRAHQYLEYTLLLHKQSAHESMKLLENSFSNLVTVLQYPAKYRTRFRSMTIINSVGKSIINRLNILSLNLDYKTAFSETEKELFQIENRWKEERRYLNMNEFIKQKHGLLLE